MPHTNIKTSPFTKIEDEELANTLASADYKIIWEDQLEGVIVKMIDHEDIGRVLVVEPALGASYLINPAATLLL